MLQTRALAINQLRKPLATGVEETDAREPGPIDPGARGLGQPDDRPPTRPRRLPGGGHHAAAISETDTVPLAEVMRASENITVRDAR
jgi:hypothetical protein